MKSFQCPKCKYGTSHIILYGDRQRRCLKCGHEFDPLAGKQRTIWKVRYREPESFKTVAPMPSTIGIKLLESLFGHKRVR